MRENRTAGWWSKVGLVLAALAASACCWLPLLLVGLGASSVSLAGVLAPYRPILMGMTFLFLGAAFYFTYRRPRTAREDQGGESCCAAAGGPRPSGAKRTARILLWPIAALALALLFLPEYIGIFAAPSRTTAERAGQERLVVQIGGMTCAGCGQIIRRALLRVGGVADAAVYHDKGYAEIFVRPGTVGRAALEAAIEKAGYTVRRPPAAGGGQP